MVSFRDILCEALTQKTASFSFTGVGRNIFKPVGVNTNMGAKPKSKGVYKNDDYDAGQRNWVRAKSGLEVTNAHCMDERSLSGCTF